MELYEVFDRGTEIVGTPKKKAKEMKGKQQKNRTRLKKCDLDKYYSIKKFFKPVVKEGDDMT